MKKDDEVATITENLSHDSTTSDDSALLTPAPLTVEEDESAALVLSAGRPVDVEGAVIRPALRDYRDMSASMSRGMVPLAGYMLQWNIYTSEFAAYCGLNQATALALPAMRFSSQFFVGTPYTMAVAVNALTSEALGRGDVVMVGRIFWLAHGMVVLATFPTIAGMQLVRYLWPAMNYTSATVEIVSDFNNVALLAVLGLGIPQVAKLFFASVGSYRPPLYRASLISTALGFSLPLVAYPLTFLTGDDWGVRGAALAMVANGVIVSLFNLLYLIRRYGDDLALWPEKFKGLWGRLREQWPELKTTSKRLLSLAIQLLAVYYAEAFGTGFARMSLAKLVDNTTAIGTSVMMQVEGCWRIVSGPLAQVIIIETARAVNSDVDTKRQNLLRVMKLTSVVTLGLSGVLLVALPLVSGPVVRILVAESVPEFPAIMADAICLFIASAALQVTDMMRLNLTGLLRGMKLQLVPTLINVFVMSGLGSLLGWLFTSPELFSEGPLCTLSGSLCLTLAYLGGTAATVASLAAYCALKFSTVAPPVVPAVVELPTNSPVKSTEPVVLTPPESNDIDDEVVIRARPSPCARLLSMFGLHRGVSKLSDTSSAPSDVPLMRLPSLSSA